MNDKTITVIKSGIKTLRKYADNTFFSKRKKRAKSLSGLELRPEFILHQHPKSPTAEAYKMLRTNIQYYDKNSKLKTILVTSSGPREGKTTTVSNLAYAFAQIDKKTLAIDSDLRNPSFHRLYGLDNKVGFTSIFLGQKSIEEIVHKDVLIPKLDIMTSGPQIKNPAEIIGSKIIAEFINLLKTKYDIIIFDSPPTLAVTDAKLLSFNADGVILILRGSKTGREVAKRAKESLAEVNAKLIGVVLNDLDTAIRDYYYQYKRYYSYYTKGKQQAETIFEKDHVPGVEIKEDAGEKVIQKKDLFTPTSLGADKKDKSPAPAEDNILTILSKEEKKDVERMSPQHKKSSDKNSALGRKTVFFKEKNILEDKNGVPNKEGNDKSGLGKKDIFKDL